LFAQISHKFGHHITDNLNVLIIDFLLQVIKTSLNDVSIKLSGDEKLSKKVHVSVHLLLLSLLKLFIVEQVHHHFRVTIIIFNFIFYIHSVETLSSDFTVSSFFVEHFEELLLAFSNQKFLEIHFLIFSIVEFFEENCAKFDIHV